MKKIVRKLGIKFDVLICVISFIGIILNFILFKSLAGFLYFTIFSNLMCFIFYLYSIIKKIRTKDYLSPWYAKIKSLVLLSLICTFLIYNFFLVPTNEVVVYKGHFMISSFVHIITPLLVLADCLARAKGKLLEYKDLLLYLSSMLFYGTTVIIYMLCGGLFLNGNKYPYFLFNVEKYGIINCIIMTLSILAVYEILGLIIIILNRKIAD